MVLRIVRAKRRERTKTETNRVLVSTVGSLLSSPVLSLLYIKPTKRYGELRIGPCPEEEIQRMNGFLISEGQGLSHANLFPPLVSPFLLFLKQKKEREERRERSISGGKKIRVL